MATYKEIRGTNIEVLSSDPSNPVEGQVWFNSTDNVLKGSAATATGSWATSNALNTARNSLGGTGTQTAALAFGGQPPNTAVTELYNGSSWTEVNDLNTARNGPGGFGTSTSSLANGGEGSSPNPKNETELWNGTNWTEVNDLNTARYSGASASQNSTSTFYAGGTTPSTGKTEVWNGTNWTEEGDLNSARDAVAGAGTATAGLAFGGGGPTGATEEFTGAGAAQTKTFTDS